jgi:hypothetical protein
LRKGLIFARRSTCRLVRLGLSSRAILLRDGFFFFGIAFVAARCDDFL